MKTVKTKIDDRAYSRLVRMRKAEGLPSISALFLQKCDLLDDEKEGAEIVKRALRIAKSKASGYRFRLRDLFPGDQWETWNVGARLRAGRAFYAKVGAAVDGIRIERKSVSGHQYYTVS